MLIIAKIKRQQDFWHAKGSELAKKITKNQLKRSKNVDFTDFFKVKKP